MADRRLKADRTAFAANEVERLIETARIANVLLQRGAIIDNVSSLLNRSVDYCQFALAFNKANDGTKLRALVEDWPLEAIQRKCPCESQLVDVCKALL